MEDFIPVNEADFEETASSGESHDDYVELVRSDMQDIDRVFDLAELFKIFGDSTRLRILSALLNHELCVCDISEVLEMNQSDVVRIFFTDFRRVGAEEIRVLCHAHFAEEDIRMGVDRGIGSA